jgi:hypothetical protein
MAMARKLFMVIFLAGAFAFCPPSYAQKDDAESNAPPVSSEGEQNDALSGGPNEKSEGLSPIVEGLENSAAQTQESETLSKGNAELEKFYGRIALFTAIFAALTIAGLSLAVLSFIFGAKKKKLAELNERIRGIEKDCTTLRDDWERAQRARSDHSASEDSVQDVETRVSVRMDELERDLRRLAETRKDMDALSRRIGVLEDDKKTREDIKKGALDPLEVFNSWAANPALSLPEAFYYLQGDFRIRVTHALKESARPSMWIGNRYGSEKYLLPNPNFFEPMTNISELYGMDMTRLKAKGQNRIQVIKPCEMADNGYVNYPGELQIL